MLPYHVTLLRDAILNSPKVQLHTLLLGGTYFSFSPFLTSTDNRMGESGAISISPLLESPHLTRLNVGRNDINEKGARALGQLLPQSKLKVLIIAGMGTRVKPLLFGVHSIDNPLGAMGSLHICGAVAVSETLEELVMWRTFLQTFVGSLFLFE